jgi:hypothetical protein
MISEPSNTGAPARRQNRPTLASRLAWRGVACKFYG